MTALNEAFQSSIIQKLWAQPFGKKAIELLIHEHKNLDINRVQDSDIKYLTPKEAYKIKADGLKFWINAGKIVGVTRSNSCFDKWFEVRKSKRGEIVCVTPEFLDMWKEKVHTWECVVGCYVLDVNDAMAKGANIKSTQASRKIARTGALALLTNRQIKQMNIARYQLLLKEKNFSDGSEFNLINNINKIFINAMSKTTPIQLFLVDLINDSFITNYMQAYSNSLVDYLEELDKGGYLLPKKDLDEFTFDELRNESNEYKLAKMKSDLKSTIDRVNNRISSGKNMFGEAVNALKKNDKKLQDFLMELRSNRDFNETAFNTCKDFVLFIDEQLPKAFANPNISSDIMNFELFTTQLIGIYEQLRNNNNTNKILNFLRNLQVFIEKGIPAGKSYADAYFEWFTINPSILKRTESYIKMIQKI